MYCEPEDAVDQIKDGLWIGGIRALVDSNVMKDMDAVVSIVERDRIHEEIFPLSIGARPCLRVCVADGDVELIQHLRRIARFISEHRADHNILIHCMAGRSRSVIALAYYMVTRMGYPTLDIALAKIQTRRPSALPKPELLIATKNYLKETWFVTTPPRIPKVPRPHRLNE